MSTFNGIVREFPRVQIDNFRLHEDRQPPLACFLSHVHSDHLTGLETINSPFVYCTAPTRELLLKLEKYPHRMNFSKGILETRKQTYRKVKRLLKPIPLETPTAIELTHGYTIQVTLFDANHCTGACMFLIEGNGKAILYTGDIRSEPWWVNSLVRSPVIIPYAIGQRRLDNIYLDTTFALGDALKMDFPTKADGLAELLIKVSRYPKDTLFYIDAWTFGYEDVWIALSKALKSQVHLCDYRYRVYGSMRSVPECFGPHTASLLGFQLGNGYHEGCLTRNPQDVRLHSCEKGSHCGILKDSKVVRITPIITRHEGMEIAEVGAGGGQGDLDQVHELELNDVMAVAQLIALCGDQLNNQPVLRSEVVRWLEKLVQSGRSAVKLDFEGFWSMLSGETANEDILNDIPLDRLVPALAKLVIGKAEETCEEATQSKRITFPFSRHSSYNELRCLVEALKPKDVYPCTVAADSWTPQESMRKLFGDICSADTFWHDQRMLAIYESRLAKARTTSSQVTIDTVSPPPSPRGKRIRPSEGCQGSDTSDITSASIKKTRIANSSKQDGKDNSELSSDASSSSTPKPRADVKPLPASTPDRHIRTPSSTAISNISSTNPRSLDRAAHRAKIAEAVKSGSPWIGLRSVNTYRNQHMDEEL